MMFVIIYIHFDLSELLLSQVLVRKYLNRIEDRVIPKDESTYITKIGRKLEVKDVMDIDDRYVTFGNQIRRRVNEKKSGYLATKEGIRWALDAAGNTGQYIRYVNMKIDKHQKQINHVKHLQQRFDREVADLQTERLEKINPNFDLNKTDAKSVTSVIDQLLLSKRNTKIKLRKLENECALAEKELEQQEIQIEEVRGYVKENNSNQNSFDQANETKALKIIKDELQYLGKNNDVNKLSNAIDIVISSYDSKF
jgi:hypothetical protein